MFPITAMGVAFRDYGDERSALQAFSRATDLGDPYAMRYAAAQLDAGARSPDAAQLRTRAQAVWQTTGSDDRAFR